MEGVTNPSLDLEKVLTDSSLPSVAIEYGELFLDGILKEGVLKEMPIVGSIIGGIQFANSIQKHLIVKKLYKFLFELKDIPEETRRSKINEINNSKKYASSVGEMIFELLEKIESDGKPEIIGKLFKAVLEEKIDYRTYLKLAHIVKSVFYYDLVQLKEMTKNDLIIGEMKDSLFLSELTDTDFVANFSDAYNDNEKGESNTKLTDLGKVLIYTGMS